MGVSLFCLLWWVHGCGNVSSYQIVPIKYMQLVTCQAYLSEAVFRKEGRVGGGPLGTASCCVCSHVSLNQGALQILHLPAPTLSPSFWKPPPSWPRRFSGFSSSPECTEQCRIFQTPPWLTRALVCVFMLGTSSGALSLFVSELNQFFNIRWVGWAVHLLEF